MDYIALPREPISYPYSAFANRREELLPYFYLPEYLNDSVRLFVPPDDSLKNGIIWVFEDKTAAFEGSFKNSFVYGFYLDVIDCGKRSWKLSEIIRDFSEKGLPLDDEDVFKKICEEVEKHYPIKEAHRKNRQILYDFIDRNLHPGEFAEIYSVWLEGTQEIYRFGLPKTEVKMNLQDLLTDRYDDLFRSPEADITETRHKRTIFKQ